jgi:hypothetical protein
MGWVYGTYGEETYNVLLGISTGRPKRRWKDNIKTNLKENERAWNGFIWLRTGTSGGLS